MIAFILPYLVRWGVKERFQRPLAWLALALAAVALAGALLGGVKLWLHLHDKAAIADHETEKRAEAAELQAAAEVEAAGARVKDAVENRDQQEAYENAIDNPKPGDPADAHLRLNCQRLQRAGWSVAELPECRGRARGAGGEAGTADRDPDR